MSIKQRIGNAALRCAEIIKTIELETLNRIGKH
jgi:hypothetical protein